MRSCVVVPSFQAQSTLGAVIESLVVALDSAGIAREDLLVVDDGSTDATASVARAHDVRVVSHAMNRGKGAALRTGLAEAGQLGYHAALTVDADGQHPAHAAHAVLDASDDPNDLVLGVRDLASAGAPRANQMSNRFSNVVLSGFAGKRLRDTQCGLRRYPIAATLALGCRAEGYAFEAEVLLRAAFARVNIREVDVDVIYPPEGERVTHFDSVRDPARIVRAVLRTMAEAHVLRTVSRSVVRVTSESAQGDANESGTRAAIPPAAE
jgi:glycosyltransferase involved in cell wall biosynthesis